MSNEVSGKMICIAANSLETLPQTQTPAFVVTISEQSNGWIITVDKNVLSDQDAIRKETKTYPFKPNWQLLVKDQPIIVTELIQNCVNSVSQKQLSKMYFPPNQ